MQLTNLTRHDYETVMFRLKFCDWRRTCGKLFDLIKAGPKFISHQHNPITH
jgi:hypothetical protein